MRLNERSNASNCSPVNVVRDRLCFRFNGIPGSDSVSELSELRPVLKQKKNVFYSISLFFIGPDELKNKRFGMKFEHLFNNTKWKKNLNSPSGFHNHMICYRNCASIISILVSSPILFIWS